MGASSSKTLRVLPKRPANNPHAPWSGARSPRPADSFARASETKDEGILQDSKDPQFLSKLSQLGQVRVDHHMQTVKLSRLQRENDATSTTPTLNHVPAPILSRLLDDRKTLHTQRDMEFLAKRFGVDLEKLDAVSMFVSTPSVHANSAQRVVQQDGDDRYIMQAVWIEPYLRNAAS
ncbi:hypothetical protein C8F01DRAFT_58277 [Mycena amicta]|nr:hypothetical protein C8F01DRAFT_58277 [Mycena amicta]